MKRLLSSMAILGLLLCAGQAFADVPSSYDYAINVKSDTEFLSITDVPFNKNLSFDYWFSGIITPRNPNMPIFTYGYSDVNQRPELVGIADVGISKANQWVTFKATIPSYVYLDPSGDMRTDISGQALNLGLNVHSGNLDSMYIRNVRMYADGGGSSDQPVPEPATLMMMGSGLIGLIGFEVRRRKANS